MLLVHCIVRTVFLFLPAAPTRRGQMLNVRGEKVSEALFLDALKKALSEWPGAQLVDYCCAESGILGRNRYLCVCTLLSFMKVCTDLNLLFSWFYRWFNWRLWSSLPGLYRAERCEEPHWETTIHGKLVLANSQHWSRYWQMICILIAVSPPSLYSWTVVSSNTRMSTSLSVSKAASDQWGCRWLQRVRSWIFAGRWWPFQTPQLTHSKCTACSAGRSTLTSSWGKRCPESWRKDIVGYSDHARGLGWALTEYDVTSFMPTTGD